MTPTDERENAGRGDLEREVESRTSSIHMLGEIARAANEARSAEEALAAALRVVCARQGWEVGHAWVLADDDSGDLVASSVWHVPGRHEFARLRQLSRDARRRPGEGFVGAVVEKGGPIHVPDLDRFDPWTRGVARELGVQAAMGFPVQVDGTTVAVLEFFHREPIRPEVAFDEVMTDVGIQVGHAIERQRLVRLVATRTDQERQSLAQQLHDDLGQELTAIALIATRLARSLGEQGSPETETAKRLAHAVDRAKTRIRGLSKALLPVEIDAEGLAHALRGLVEAADPAYPQIEARFECDRPVSVDDGFVATQLFRIAQEGLYNAFRHAGPRRVVLGLSDADGLELTVTDDGRGMPDPPPVGSGSGLRIMRHRCGLIGGELTFESPAAGGTILRCRVPTDRTRRADRGT